AQWSVFTTENLATDEYSWVADHQRVACARFSERQISSHIHCRLVRAHSVFWDSAAGPAIAHLAFGNRISARAPAWARTVRAGGAAPLRSPPVRTHTVAINSEPFRSGAPVCQ